MVQLGARFIVIYCPVCDFSISTQVDFIDGVPVFLNRKWPTADAAKAADVGTLAIQECGRCGFVWNSAFEPDRAVYDQFYENDQTHSAAFRNHLKEMADRVIAAAGNQSFHLLEIGCGQGTFLNEIATRAGSLLSSATGYDPTYRGSALQPNIEIVPEYFNRDTASLMSHRPNIVVTRHTIEHVPDTVRFLSNIRDAITGDASILIETPDVEWILSRGEIQDLFYEHCSLFTLDSLGRAMVRAGWQPIQIDRVFGGQYLCALGTATLPTTASPEFSTEAHRPNRLDRAGFVNRWQKKIQDAEYPVALWGAGAKGVTFAMLTDPDGKLIRAIVDINPEKQGCYLPKSGIPIMSPQKAVELGVKTFFVMNPNYLKEISAELASIGSEAKIIPIIGGYNQ
jgi:hypothetical protein